MNDDHGSRPHYEWHVVKVREHELQGTLDALDEAWEVFSVIPTIHFGVRVMGTPVPSEILYSVIARRPK
ncbi:MAG: hypothetical protein ABFD16_01090 [Thermoguttaceae bacterium]|jgi:hypothetical protein